MNSVQVLSLQEKGLSKAGIVFLGTGCLAFFGKCLCPFKRFQDSRARVGLTLPAVVDLLLFSTLGNFISTPIGGRTSLTGNLLRRYDPIAITDPMPENGCLLQRLFLTALCHQISRALITNITAISKLHQTVTFLPFSCSINLVISLSLGNRFPSIFCLE